MNEFADAIHADINAIFEQRLTSAAQRERVVSMLMEGFGNVRKKAMPDLEARLQAMQKRMQLLTENVNLGFVNGRLVVKVTGSSESLLTELRHGSSWYEPWEKVDELLLAAIMTDPSK